MACFRRPGKLGSMALEAPENDDDEFGAFRPEDVLDHVRDWLPQHKGKLYDEFKIVEDDSGYHIEIACPQSVVTVGVREGRFYVNNTVEMPPNHDDPYWGAMTAVIAMLKSNFVG